MLIRIQAGLHGNTLTTADGQNLNENSASIPELRVINGSASVSIDRPGILEGVLFGLQVQRSSGEAVSYPIAEFTHEVTEENWQSGITSVDMNTYREVLIKARNPDGQSAVRRPISLPTKVNFCMDLTTDERGEAKLLLAAGHYYIFGLPPVNFEVTIADSEKIVEVTLRAGPQVSPTPDH
jgi:hypothetical protein